MLEFKNVSISLDDDRVSTSFSLELQGGEVACLVGPEGSGKSGLLKAVMGLQPLAAGYITVDGELVTPGSSSYFRRMMAYVPQQLPRGKQQVGQLIDGLFSLHQNKECRPEQKLLMEKWALLDLQPELWEKALDDLSADTLWRVMLAAVPFLKRPIVLLDNPPEETVVDDFVRQLADSGAEVLCATRNDVLQYQKIINLS